MSPPQPTTTTLSTPLPKPTPPTTPLSLPNHPTPTNSLLIRESVTRFLHHHNFTVTPHRYTTVPDLYDHWCNFDPGSKTASNATLRHFQTALGRVLRPRTVEPEWKNVIKNRKMYGISGDGIQWVDLKIESQDIKDECGKRRRDVGKEGMIKKRGERGRRRKVKDRCDGGREEKEGKGLVVHFGYVDEFVAGLKCAPDLLMMGLFPNGKELTESMSAFAAVREFCMRENEDGFQVLKADDSGVTMIAVGDGCTPRTGGLFAFRTSWRCVSIDPMLRCGKKKPYMDIDRLELLQEKVQDVKVVIKKRNGEFGKVVLVAWHAHVSLKQALHCLIWEGEAKPPTGRKLRERVAVVSCSCCNWDDSQRHLPDGYPPDAEYEDGGVASAKRTVRVWRLLHPFEQSHTFHAPVCE